MTLRELIADKHYTEDNFIAMYNKDDKWFYGSYVGERYLEEYLDYEIVKDEPVGEGFIRHVQLKEYPYPLGLGSMREKWAHEELMNSKKR